MWLITIQIFSQFAVFNIISRHCGAPAASNLPSGLNAKGRLVASPGRATVTFSAQFFILIYEDWYSSIPSTVVICQSFILAMYLPDGEKMAYEPVTLHKLRCECR